MAASNGRGKAKPKDAAPATLTAYVVLERVDLAQLAGDVSKLGLGARADWTAWLPVLNQTVDQGPDGQPRVFVASSKPAAIRMHTGDGEGVIPGSWKAVPVSNWKGGETTKTKVTADRQPLDEVLA